MKHSHREQISRLDDVLSAIDAIRAHLGRGGLEDSLVFDAVRMRLVEIGEAVSTLPDEVLAGEPGIPWREVVAMRHKLARHCYDSALDLSVGASCRQRRCRSR